MSVFIQEGCALNRDLVQLTSPRPKGQGAREGTFLTSEIVQPSASLLSSWPLQAVWIVTTLRVFSDSALVSAVFAPFEIASRHSHRGVAFLLILRFYGIKVKITGLGVFGAIARGTERRLKGGTSSGTTDPLATSRVLWGVV